MYTVLQKNCVLSYTCCYRKIVFFHNFYLILAFDTQLYYTVNSLLGAQFHTNNRSPVLARWEVTDIRTDNETIAQYAVQFSYLGTEEDDGLAGGVDDPAVPSAVAAGHDDEDDRGGDENLRRIYLPTNTHQLYKEVRTISPSTFYYRGCTFLSLHSNPAPNLIWILD